MYLTIETDKFPRNNILYKFYLVIKLSFQVQQIGV